ncbi:MAG TPA: ubiquinone/menaquinone biosynthesis methyltransferase [Planctomycetota bacterium]|jgi:demethylmenaquinone methyltransferase/2-methoxy-6-polyprenyl-1,4-benzoquinol methylase|nr:ubiquinone/menaquinone biosynthesis methyltransferase [Planctomycetota bacterium]
MVDKSPARIRAMFDQISPRYDFLNHLLSLNSDVLWRRRAAERLAGARLVLDVCSGTGDLAFEIHRRSGARVVGTDFSRRMLDLARLKARRRGLERDIRFQQADTLRLPFRDAAFDAVAVAFGLRNVADPARALAEMARVARPGGDVLVLEFSLPPCALLRRAYLLYFSRVLPRVGRWIARSEIDAYRYLPDSVARWPDPEALTAALERAGLRDVSCELLFGGVAALHVGRRP